MSFKSRLSLALSDLILASSNLSASEPISSVDIKRIQTPDVVETIPGKSWFVIFRMYGPMDKWIKKEWRPSEVELVK